MTARALVALLVAVPLLTTQPVTRPKILGVAHIAVFVSDLTKARAFYEDLLGFDEPFTLPKPDGSVQIAFVKINDRQWIELFNQPTAGEGQLNHIALYTDDADRMRDYLAAKGVEVPATVGRGRTGNKNFTIRIDGHTVEIVEYQPTLTAKDAGNHARRRRVSGRARRHPGRQPVENRSIPVCSFEFWRGSAPPQTLSWVNMRVPDGGDYIELMLYDELPPPDRRGPRTTCLLVPERRKAVAMFDARPSRSSYTRAVEIRTGINRKRQVNLFDPAARASS